MRWMAMRVLMGLIGASTASAQSIDSILGVPGSPEWDAACGPDRELPTGPSQLSSCDPAIDNCLQRVTVDLSAYPTAVCNDHSPAVFYGRRGTGDDAAKWMIHLQGGGKCTTRAECTARWCGLDHDAAKMTTALMPAYAEAGGLYKIAGDNAFSNWNHVWIYYCSSDYWVGQGVAEYEEAGVSPDPAMTYLLPQRGHEILVAVREMLRKTGPSAGWHFDVPTPINTLPDLDDAEIVVLNGTSAGAKGALMNADWFLFPFDEAERLLVLDANFDMTDAVLAAHSVELRTATGGLTDTLANWRATTAENGWLGGWEFEVGAFADETCEAAYRTGGEMYKCSRFDTLLTDGAGVTTPTLLRLDLADPSLAKRWIAPWPSGEYLAVDGVPGTAAAFRALNRESLLEIAASPVGPVKAVFGPRCEKHIGIPSRIASINTSTPHATVDAYGVWSSTPPDYSFHDMLVDWIASPMSSFLAVDSSGPPAFSSCP